MTEREAEDTESGFGAQLLPVVNRLLSCADIPAEVAQLEAMALRSTEAARRCVARGYVEYEDTYKGIAPGAVLPVILMQVLRAAAPKTVLSEAELMEILRAPVPSGFAEDISKYRVFPEQEATDAP